MNWSGMKTKFSVYLLLSIFLIMFLPNLATAVTSTTGDVDPAYPSGAPATWYVDANMVNPGFDANYVDLIIGNAADGTLLISDGNSVQDANAYIGFATSVSGTVDVNDSYWGNYDYYDAVDEKWYNGGDLYVGYEGEGVLNIFNDGYVWADRNGYIGFAPGSSGMVDVNYAELDIDQDLYVGYGGDGTLVISNNGYVYSGWDTYIGYEPNSTGSVTVTGGQYGEGWEASELYSSGEIIVGYEGDGTLLVEEGGYVYASDGLYIGGYPDVNGIVTVTGGTIYDEDPNGLFTGSYQDQSYLDSGSDLIVGVEGNGTLLIEDGAYVYTSYDGIIGYDSGSTGSVTVTGPGSYHEDANVVSTSRREIDGSEWYIDEDLIVGYDGDGELMISDGGYVETYDSTYIGYESGSRGMVTVTGGGFWQEPSDPLVD